MENEEQKSIANSILLIGFGAMTFQLVVTFPTYFAGFFFGLLFYSFIDAFIKKDL
tara:strand:- start:2988 stop:3152 length:165 start_codon:yes stop_codon:yes gene_type:complete